MLIRLIPKYLLHYYRYRFCFSFCIPIKTSFDLLVLEFLLENYLVNVVKKKIEFK